MHKFTLDSDVEDMDEADLRSTLDEFMEKHGENVSDYEAVEADRDEFSESVEDLEAEVSEYSATQEALAAKFAEVVASDSPLFEADEVAERFSLDELLTKADSIGVFSLPAEGADGGVDEPEGDDEGTTFDDKPGRAPTESGDGSQFSDEVEDDLSTIIGGL